MAERDAGARTYKTVAMPATIRAGRKFGQSRADRVAAAMSEIINKEADAGWAYLGSDTVRSQERQGFFGGQKETVYTVLVFERAAPTRVEPTVAEAEQPRRRRGQADALEEAARSARRVAAEGSAQRPRRGYGFDEALTADRDDDAERRPLRRREARMAARRGEEEWGAENGRDANGRGARGLVETMRQQRGRS